MEGIKFAIAMGKTETMHCLNATLVAVDYPQCREYNLLSDEHIECMIRYNTFGGNHLVGTCKMGPDAATSVVDHRLRVHGVNGLRVIDASIIPKLIGGHTNAAAIMIAEKCADMIKKKMRIKM